MKFHLLKKMIYSFYKHLMEVLPSDEEPTFVFVICLYNQLLYIYCIACIVTS